MSAEDKAIEETAKAVRHYLDNILTAPLSEFGLLLKDKISYWRFKNQVKTALKAKALLESRGVDPRAMAGRALPDLVVPLLEAAGETSDDSLSNMFANLLADALDPQTASLIHPSYGKVLNQLSPLDAQILNSLYAEVSRYVNQIESGGLPPDQYNTKLPAHRQLGFDEPRLAATLNLDSQIIRLSFENVRRLGLCDEGYDFLSRANKLGRICFTDYGFSFIRKCTQHSAS